MRAAIYARYSSDNQQDASIEDQIRLCREWAKKQGWEVVGQYKDRAISGGSMLRSGIQHLMEDALAGRIDIVIAEALDRLSRDQADIATFYKRMRFADVEIFTLSDGKISDLHIGLKGTMNALFLKDLADKTRRGLRGRIEAGKSGGGNSFGYDVVRSFAADGTPRRGDRTINAREAGIIRAIFSDYADGKSPRAIAKDLNVKAITGPSGKAWGPSTIHGNPIRGTGILNNELYIGKMVWNRLRYIRDPETGKRVSRLNPQADWVTHDVPHLRIIEDELWQAVKDRQSAASLGPQTKQSTDGFWDKRRPRYLFSGLIVCGCCDGQIVNLNSVRLGCTNARNKGTCDNRRTIRRDMVETTILDALKQHLMEPDLFAVFCDEYTRHMNMLRIEATSSLTAYKRELARVTKDIDRLINAITDGVAVSQVKDKMLALDLRKAELEQLIRQTDEPQALLHPNMAMHYREEIARLHQVLNDDISRHQAAEIIRTLVDKIVLRPLDQDAGKDISIELHGDLAGILSLSAQTKKPPQKGGDFKESTKLVAGAGFEPATFRL